MQWSGMTVRALTAARAAGYTTLAARPVGVAAYGGRSSVGRAPGCGPGGRGFEPRRSPHQNNKALEPETIRPQGFWLIEGVLRVNSHELHRYGGLAHMVETSIHMCETSFSGFRAGDS
jgi:hypothetical protein